MGCLCCDIYKWLDLILVFSDKDILGDPGADSGGEGKSKRAEKCGTKKSKERREELFSPFFTFLRSIYIFPPVKTFPRPLYLPLGLRGWDKDDKP